VYEKIKKDLSKAKTQLIEIACDKLNKLIFLIDDCLAHIKNAEYQVSLSIIKFIMKKFLFLRENNFRLTFWLVVNPRATSYSNLRYDNIKCGVFRL
jgi:hypothetical protein